MPAEAGEADVHFSVTMFLSRNLGRAHRRFAERMGAV